MPNTVDLLNYELVPTAPDHGMFTHKSRTCLTPGCTNSSLGSSMTEQWGYEVFFIHQSLHPAGSVYLDSRMSPKANSSSKPSPRVWTWSCLQLVGRFSFELNCMNPHPLAAHFPKPSTPGSTGPRCGGQDAFPAQDIVTETDFTYRKTDRGVVGHGTAAVLPAWSTG